MMPYRSWVEVSRAQIGANFEAIRQTVGANVEVMPVVKADAYRHGAVEVSRVLEDPCGRDAWTSPRGSLDSNSLRMSAAETPRERRAGDPPWASVIFLNRHGGLQQLPFWVIRKVVEHHPLRRRRGNSAH